MEEILTTKERIEFEKRGLIPDIMEICREVKAKKRKANPKMSNREINEISRKEIFKRFEKRTRELRKLEMKDLSESLSFN